MEISIRYIFVKLQAIFPITFTLLYFIGDTDSKLNENIVIKDRVSILTGTCIAIFYIYKFIKEIAKTDELEVIKEDIKKLSYRVEELENDIRRSQLPPAS